MHEHVRVCFLILWSGHFWGCLSINFTSAEAPSPPLPPCASVSREPLRRMPRGGVDLKAADFARGSKCGLRGIV